MCALEPTLRQCSEVAQMWGHSSLIFEKCVLETVPRTLNSDAGAWALKASAFIHIAMPGRSARERAAIRVGESLTLASRSWLHSSVCRCIWGLALL